VVDLVVIWTFLQELGTVAQLGVLVVVFIIWRNDLRHVQATLDELRKDFAAHIKWHLNGGKK